MSKLTKEELEKENLNDEIERALHALVNSSTDVCPLPIPTPEEIESRNKSLKNIADEFLKKADESRRNE
jgi:hypothetical protein